MAVGESTTREGQGGETLATILNKVEDRLYFTLGNLPEDVKPSKVEFVIADKKKIEAYSKCQPAMARVGREEGESWAREPWRPKGSGTPDGLPAVHAAARR